MANITFPFALLLSFPPIVCLAMLAAVGHSIYNRYFHPLTKTARSYMGQSYRLVQALRSVGKTHSHVSISAT